MKHRQTKVADPDRWRMPFDFWLVSALLLISGLAKVVMLAGNWMRMASD